MTRLAAALFVAVVLAGPAAAAPGPLTVWVDRTQVSTSLGHSFVFRSTIANRSNSPPTALPIFLSILRGAVLSM